MRTGDDIRDDLRLGRIRHRRLEHADDRGRAIAQPDRLSDDVRVRLKGRGPEAVREHRGPGRGGAVVGRTEQASDRGPQPHHLEVGATHDTRADDPRLAQPEHRELDGGEVAEGRERLHPSLQVAQLGHREVRVFGAHAPGALADVDERVLVAVDERPEQHAAHDAEDGGIGADAQGQRQHDGGREAPGAGEGTDGVAKIRQEAHGRVLSGGPGLDPEQGLCHIVERHDRISTHRRGFVPATSRWPRRR